MSESTWQTVTTARDLASANVARSLLNSAGIEAWIPDQHLAGVAWHLGQAIGGIRVQVRSEFATEARAILEAELPGDQNGAPNPEQQVSVENEGDALAHRAFKATVVSTLLMIVAPYALSLALRALAVGGLSPSAFRRAIFAALVSAAWPTLILYLIFTA